MFHLQNIIGPFLNKSANSLGISKAFKYLCDSVGINCLIVNGEFKKKEKSWNMVQIGEFFYHIDVEENLANVFNAPFFCVDDRIMFREHAVI